MEKANCFIQAKKRGAHVKNLKRLMLGGYSDNDTIKRNFLFVFVILPVIFTLTGCAMLGLPKDTGIDLPTSQKVQGNEDMLQPGLSVLYFHQFYRHIDEMPRGRMINARGIPGKPILILDHHFGEDLEIFKSGRAKGVGMHMEGFILFEKMGDYVFQANTNDGFRLFISELRIINDPTVHSDRMSDKGMVRVAEPGWYPIRILYFQRKGTATIQLFWKKPGDKTMDIVPAEAYAHIPRQG
jgi:hypothetical protein